MMRTLDSVNRDLALQQIGAAVIRQWATLPLHVQKALVEHVLAKPEDVIGEKIDLGSVFGG